MKASLTVLNSKKGVSIKLIIMLLITLVAITIAAVMGAKKLGISFEKDAPTIKITNLPKGLSITPANLEIELEDLDSGLDEIIIRYIQKKNQKILKKEKLNGKKNISIDLLLNGKESGITEGKFEIEIKAFDRSFWSNKSTETITMTVDYTRPTLNPVSTQHNIQMGGSQLAIYQTTDEYPQHSGVKVGNHLFLGFPAKGLDPDYEDESTFISLFAVNSKEELKLFSEDRVGNTNSKGINYKLFDTQYPKVTWNFSETTLRVWINNYLNSELIKDVSEEEKTMKGFELLFGKERISDSGKIEKIVTKTKNNKLWSGQFIQPTEGIRTPFGAKIDYQIDGNYLGSGIMQGYEFTGNQKLTVEAANSGIVIYSGELGTYGKTIIIDHGLGLSTIYSSLSEIDAKEGVKVDKGELIGSIGNSGISRGKSLLFEIRVQGTPVDAREWWSKDWYEGHLRDKLNDAKYNMGITNTESFD